MSRLEARAGYEALARAAEAALEQGIEALTRAAQEALDQAQHGKGHERHGADDVPFLRQAMFQILARVGPGYTAGQYAKKMAEAMRLEPDARRRDLYGAAIEALATAVFFDGAPP